MTQISNGTTIGTRLWRKKLLRLKPQHRQQHGLFIDYKRPSVPVQKPNLPKQRGKCPLETKIQHWFLSLTAFCIHKWDLNKCEHKMSATFDGCNTASGYSQWDVTSSERKGCNPTGIYTGNHPSLTPRLSWSWIVFNLILNQTQPLYFNFFFNPRSLSLIPVVMIKPWPACRISWHVTLTQRWILYFTSELWREGPALSSVTVSPCLERGRAHYQCSGRGYTSWRQTALQKWVDFICTTLSPQLYWTNPYCEERRNKNGHRWESVTWGLCHKRHCEAKKTVSEYLGSRLTVKDTVTSRPSVNQTDWLWTGACF